VGVENSHVRFLGNLVLNLWDCGGYASVWVSGVLEGRAVDFIVVCLPPRSQDTFMENYFESQKEQIFRNVEVLIYVFDIESQEPEGDMDTFRSCLQAIQQNSKNAHIFCLVHKMDVIHQPEERLLVSCLLLCIS